MVRRGVYHIAKPISQIPHEMQLEKISGKGREGRKNTKEKQHIRVAGKRLTQPDEQHAISN